ncbi:MAG: hypothetical protein AAF333_14455 [Planctomycetota bacterium]
MEQKCLGRTDYSTYDPRIDVVRWKSEILRWDLPDRFLAGFGCIWLTFVAILAGAARVITERLGADFDIEIYSSAWIAACGITIIASLYLLTMLASAVLLAMPPREGKTTLWLSILVISTGFYAVVLFENTVWWFRGMKTII